MIKQALKGAAERLGYSISRRADTEPPLVTPDRRRLMMAHLDIRMVLDIGANVGQYATWLREAGYADQILSFEPLSQAYAALAQRASNDPKWRAFHMAIGAADGEAEINVAANSESSSLLAMTDAHTRAAPSSQYVSTERVSVRTLETAVKDLLPPGVRTLLKMDTQGYEESVIRGAGKILERVDLIECELSLTTLYEGQRLLPGMIERLDSAGFRPVFFEPGFTDRETGYCLQMDGFFVRKHPA